jgi:hypothetical protein
MATVVANAIRRNRVAAGRAVGRVGGVANRTRLVWLAAVALGLGAVGLRELVRASRTEAERAYWRIEPTMSQDAVFTTLGAEPARVVQLTVGPDEGVGVGGYDVPDGEYSWAAYRYDDSSVLHLLFNPDGSLHHYHFTAGAAPLSWPARFWRHAKAVVGL